MSPPVDECDEEHRYTEGEVIRSHMEQGVVISINETNQGQAKVHSLTIYTVQKAENGNKAILRMMTIFSQTIGGTMYINAVIMG